VIDTQALLQSIWPVAHWPPSGAVGCPASPVIGVEPESGVMLLPPDDEPPPPEDDVDGVVGSFGV
jgi:hypothetical protein